MTKKSKQKTCHSHSTNDLPLDTPVSIKNKSRFRTVNEEENEETPVLPTRFAVIRILESAINFPIVPLIEGPVGCGKTTFIEQFAKQHGKIGNLSFYIIQMGEQVDAKSLFGTYQCAEIPGEFVWKPSVLTTAILEGNWILLEDIDCAPADVLGALMPLIESRQISIPGRLIIDAHQQFRLFVTIRTSLSTQLGNKAILLSKFWLRIRLNELTSRELARIIVFSYPRLSIVSQKLVEAFCRVVEIAKSSVKPGRLLGTRDLLKWCNRLDNSCGLDDSVGIFQEAIAVLAVFESDKQRRFALMKTAASMSSIPDEKVEYFARKHCPIVRITESEATFGRVILKRTSCQLSMSNEQFALTRTACVLLEQIAMCIRMNEPALLIGETGCGKTAAVQFLAQYTGRKLRVVNLSQQSEAADLFGGYKPVPMKTVLEPLRQEYLQFFTSRFDTAKNAKFLQHIDTCFASNRWPELLQLMVHTVRTALMSGRWAETEQCHRLLSVLRRFQRVAKHPHLSPFAFVQGVLLMAAKNGEWILLDEINLASAETLNCLCTLLNCTDNSRIIDDGCGNSVTVHPDFRVLACMNPATDVGKRDLPPGLRNRFTELFVDDVDDQAELLVLTQACLQCLPLSASVLVDIVQFYMNVRQKAPLLTSDGWGRHPNYSLRTFCRALNYASGNPYGNELRSVYEAFCMSFLTEVDSKSRQIVESLIRSSILGKNAKQILGQPIPEPVGRNAIKIEGYWVEKGEEMPVCDQSYVTTTSVKNNMRDVARVITTRLHPVLLQGETSVGKTSLIRHLARMTGNTAIRINNHEHTDVQEYLGSYTIATNADNDDDNGRLVFVEGPLIQAMRKGHWVILDELNLAPPDVLEALNRLLDDNRELFIPETNTVVRAHPRFVLLATQNPPGLYGGRKRLSRAFANRFVQLTFDELPTDQLQVILRERCSLPDKYAQKMVAVMQQLQLYRNSSGVFAGKESYMTLRDLFRWGERYRKCARAPGEDAFDWEQYLADQGYFLLGGRCRRPDDEQVVRTTIEQHWKRPLDLDRLFGIGSTYLDRLMSIDMEHLVWTETLRRTAVLTCQCLLYDEPALLVGDTGGGKTSLCQLLLNAPEVSRPPLLSLNCHLTTEAADFLGRLRPTISADRLFEWVDGPLVTAMKQGRGFLADEISLAADSVLERLNSVLEPDRQLLISESSDVLTAKKGFQFVATMNPGGDYGKKELSKALRNRFTEIWCPSTYSRSDLLAIVAKNIRPQYVQCGQSQFDVVLVDFVQWFKRNFANSVRCAFTLRDIVAWVNLHNTCCAWGVDPALSVLHGVCLTLLDSLGSFSPSITSCSVRDQSITRLSSRMSIPVVDFELTLHLTDRDGQFGIDPFLIPCTVMTLTSSSGYSFDAPTCKRNLYRLLRALSINKPILLEGPPGAGKSSLVVSLAKKVGRQLTRLNLSDQTDLGDLFGSDLPCVDAEGRQSFVWNDGPLLRAMKNGHWILLDEMNLASQTVLEGLNACLDHRGEVFIPELARTFSVGDGSTRFFACQNPFTQGGNRRGLPKSFVNRFSLVYTESLQPTDELIILRKLFGNRLDDDSLEKMVKLNDELNRLVGVGRQFGNLGGPWEFNLRDLIRWAQLVVDVKNGSPAMAFDVLYTARMRSSDDRQRMRGLYQRVFDHVPGPSPCSFWMTDSELHLGPVRVSRRNLRRGSFSPLIVTRSAFRTLQRLAICTSFNWLSLVVGTEAVGKSSLVQLFAALCGREIKVFHLTADTDALELLGSFEQVSTASDYDTLMSKTRLLLADHDEYVSRLKSIKDAAQLGDLIEQVVEMTAPNDALTELLEELRNCQFRFEWVNSPFLDAYINGHWLLVENVNCCSSAVLDRLNAALEPDGELILTEKGGSVTTFVPHPDFRAFFTMNPQLGRLSRAMRNRAVELCLQDEDIWLGNQMDVAQVLGSFHISAQRANALLTEFRASDPRPSPYSLIESAFSMAVQGTEDGHSMTSHVDIPPLNSLLSSSPSNVLSIWTLQVWHHLIIDSSNVQSPFYALLFALLSSTTPDFEQFRATLLVNFESNVLEKVKKTLLKLIYTIRMTNKEGDNQKLWDGRFFGVVELNKTNGKCSKEMDEDTANRLVVLMIRRVFSCLLSSIIVQIDSPMFISDRFVKKRICVESLSSPSLQYIHELCSSIGHFLHQDVGCKDSSISNALKVLDLVIFVGTVSEPIDETIGCARVQLAWQIMHTSFLQGQSFPTRLRRLVSLISSEWTTNAKNEATFIESYHEFSVARPCDSVEKINSIGEIWRRARIFSLNRTNQQQRLNFWTHLEDGSFGDVPRSTNPPYSPTEIALLSARELFCALLIDSVEICHVHSRLAEYLLQEQPSCIPTALILSRTVDWKNFQEIALRLTWLNSSESVHAFGRQFKNLHLAFLPLITQLVLNIWQPLSFSNSFIRIPISEVPSFVGNIATIAALLWRAGPNMLDFGRSLRLKVASMFNELLRSAVIDPNVDRTRKFNEDDEDLWTNLLHLGLILLRQTTPPKNMLDPVVRARQQRILLERKLSMLVDQLDLLDRFFLMTTGEKILNCLTAHPHPLFQHLHCQMNTVKSELQNPDLIQTTDRPTATLSFNRLVAELISFTIMTIESLEKPFQEDLTTSIMRVARLKAWCLSGERFLFQTLYSDLHAFPDLTLPYSIALNCLLVGAQAEIFTLEREIDNKKDAISSSFYQMCTGIDTVLYDEIASLAINSDSSVPIRMQAKIAAEMSNKDANDRVLEWLSRNWGPSHADTVEKEEKNFEYRARNTLINEDERELLEMRERFPDFSSIEAEKPTESMERMQSLKPEDICLVLKSVLNGHAMTSSPNSYCSFLWLLMHQFGNNGPSSGLDTILYDDHIRQLHLLNPTRSRSRSRLDVYRDTDLSVLTPCCTSVSELRQAASEVLVKWPDLAALKAIIFDCDRLLSLSSSTPLMRIAAGLEALLDQCQTWETVAHRGVSLEKFLAPLRTLLVSWRKLEVQCWETLLDTVDDQLHDAALFASYPLVQACEKLSSGESQESSLLSTLLEWLESATIADFEARLEAVQLCTFFLILRSDDLTIHRRFRSIHFFYEQYKKTIADKYNDIRQSFQTDLKEFVQIAKYNDLNLWSVKLSAQKAHQQLFRIIKRYKLALHDPVRPFFSRQLDISSFSTKILPIPQFVESNCAFFHIDRQNHLCSNIVKILTGPLLFDNLENLAELATITVTEITAPVQYIGSDDQKEKHHGRSLTRRKKFVSDLLKSIRNCGILYRKGTRLDRNGRTMTILTELDGNLKAESGLRLVGSDRILVMTLLDLPNEQLNVNTSTQMRGIVEFVPNVLFKARHRLGSILPAIARMSAFSNSFKSILEDHDDHHSEGRPCSSSSVKTCLLAILHSLSNANDSLTECESLWKCAPNSDCQWPQINQFLPINSVPFSALCSEDGKFISLIGRLRNTIQVVEKLKSLTESVLNSGIFADDIYFWKRSNLQPYSTEFVSSIKIAIDDVDRLLGNCSAIDQLPTNPFDRTLKSTHSKLLDALDQIRPLINCWTDAKRVRLESNSYDSTDLLEQLLLLVQKVYKDLTKVDTSPGIDQFPRLFDRLFDSINLSSIDRVNKSLMHLHETALFDHSESKSLHSLSLACRNSVHLLRFITDFIDQLSSRIIPVYHSISTVFLKLAKDGYVNPIPKMDKSDDDGQGKMTFEDNRNAGLGEGEGAKDISDQIEEESQVEGLKGDNQDDGIPPPKDSDSDQKPIDMDDDFAADLEDIDFENHDEHSDSDDGSDEQQEQPDSKMDDVDDDQQENQLDPKLWDEEKSDGRQQKADEKTQDDGTEGANEMQQELGAKDQEGKETTEEELGPEEEINGGNEEEIVGDDMEQLNLENGIDEEDEEEEMNNENQLNQVDELNQVGSDDDDEMKDGEEIAENDHDAAKKDTQTESATEMMVTCDSGTGQSIPNELCVSINQDDGTNQLDQNSQNQAEMDEIPTGSNEAASEMGKTTKQNIQNEQKCDINKTKKRGIDDEEKTLGDANKSLLKASLEQYKGNEKTREQGEKSNVYSHTVDGVDDGQMSAKATLNEAQKSGGLVDGDEQDMRQEEEQEEIRPSGPDNEKLQTPKFEQVTELHDSCAHKSDTIDVNTEICANSDASTIHTMLDFFQHASAAFSDPPNLIDTPTTFTNTGEGPPDEVYRQHWNRLNSATNSLAAELCENLRLILEPTKATRLEGDYRSGKRLNLRRLIPYVASHFRKDKIWLRRTKKSGREYQIVIAVDDSSSMADNKTKQLTYESLSLLEAALRHLESGSLAVCKFGESVQMLHSFDDNFGPDAGPNLLARLSFSQTNTDVCQLLSFVSAYLDPRRTACTGPEPAQLLLIVSDGRGLFTSGMDRVRRAVRAITSAGVFVVFVIVDNPEHKNSIVDIKLPTFGSDGVPRIHSYMHFFPFPFYVILRRISALPAVLGDALRQWFEIVSDKA